MKYASNTHKKHTGNSIRIIRIIRIIRFLRMIRRIRRRGKFTHNTHEIRIEYASIRMKYIGEKKYARYAYMEKITQKQG